MASDDTGAGAMNRVSMPAVISSFDPTGRSFEGGRYDAVFHRISSGQPVIAYKGVSRRVDPIARVISPVLADSAVGI